jgi:hypothetical protein
MKKILIIALVFSFQGMALGAILSDSFDDNNRDSLIWGHPWILTNTTQFIEQNQRTEFIVSGSSSTNIPPAAGVFQDALIRLTAELDWTASVDICNSFHASTSNMVCVGASLFNYDFTYDTGLYLSATNSELKLYKNWFVLNYPAPLEEVFYAGNLTATGSVRFSYSAVSQMVEVAYANDIDKQYDRLFSIDTSEWRDIRSTGFILSLSAAAVHTDVASGAVALDNVLVEQGLEPSVAIGESVGGDLLIRFTGTLKYAESLVTGWNPMPAVTNSPAVVPTTNSQLFIRSTMP